MKGEYDLGITISYNWHMKNNRIGIITLFGYFNYGNRLQNYALQKILEKYDYTVDTIVVYPNYKQHLKTVLCFFKSFLGDISSKRYLQLHKFTRKYINTRGIISSNYKIPKLIQNKYTFFVVGSDQVWNPNLRIHERDNFFLRFARKEQRICIAPSFGVSSISPENVVNYRDGLNGFKYLCAREKAGIDIISDLTGREAEIIIDPTLVIERNEWKKLFNFNNIECNDYILLAMLGRISDNVQKYIKKIAKINKLEIIDVFNTKSAYSPIDVLRLIDNAKLVFTDSFHFTAFSINFNIPFIVIEREDDEINSSMYSRIESLLSIFKLTNRKFNEIKEIGFELLCDFKYTNIILSNERIKFYEYLEKNLDHKIHLSG